MSTTVLAHAKLTPPRYECLNPAEMKEGDVVEATFSFIAYHLQEKCYKIVVVLRALSLILSEIREVRSRDSQCHRVSDDLAQRSQHQCKELFKTPEVGEK